MITPEQMYLELELERDRLVEQAESAISHAEFELGQLQRNLQLARKGKRYRALPGAGQKGWGHPDYPDFGKIYAAFDAIERCAKLKPEEGS